MWRDNVPRRLLYDLRQELLTDATLGNDGQGPAKPILEKHLVIDTEQVVDSGENVIGRKRILYDVAGDRIRLADDCSLRESATGQNRRISP